MNPALGLQLVAMPGNLASGCGIPVSSRQSIVHHLRNAKILVTSE